MSELDGVYHEHTVKWLAGQTFKADRHCRACSHWKALQRPSSAKLAEVCNNVKAEFKRVVKTNTDVEDEHIPMTDMMEQCMVQWEVVFKYWHLVSNQRLSNISLTGLSKRGQPYR